jgi:hypothetical protein
LSKIGCDILPVINELKYVISAKIKNLVGGKISCGLTNTFVHFLNSELEFKTANFNDLKAANIFAIDFFDYFSSNSKNTIFSLNVDNIIIASKWQTPLPYYIRFDVIIITPMNNRIVTPMIVVIDELASLYFTPSEC